MGEEGRVAPPSRGDLFNGIPSRTFKRLRREQTQREALNEKQKFAYFTKEAENSTSVAKRLSKAVNDGFTAIITLAWQSHQSEKK